MIDSVYAVKALDFDGQTSTMTKSFLKMSFARGDMKEERNIVKDKLYYKVNLYY